MIKFIRRWKLVFIILGTVSSGLLLLTALMAAGGAIGIGLQPADWKRVLIFHAVLLFGFMVFALRVWYWMKERMVRRFEQALDRMQGIQEACIYDKELAASGEKSYALDLDPIHAVDQILDRYAHFHSQVVENLKRANSFWFSLIEHNTDAIYVMDLEGKILRVNPAFETLYGFKEAEVSGIRQPFVPERLQEEYFGLIQRVKEGCEVSGYETVRKTKDGRDIHISLTLSPVLHENGELVALAAICRNITERKETEEVFHRSEKLTVIGQLAAGVAHEIRNPLTTLRGFVQLLKQRKAGNLEHLELMLEELDRINFIVSEFIILSKPHLSQFTLKDPADLVTDMIRLLEPQSAMNNIHLEIRLSPDLPRIRCEENQLKQVFLNVIKNGMESMPDGGVIRIEAMRLDPGKILIRFTDHGTGIPEDILMRLGEPFLTSKENGTGLGILVSQQIVANHKGRMLIRSELGKGTSVDIELPVDLEQPAKERAPDIKMGMTL